MVVGGCTWPNSARAVLIGTATFALGKIPIVSVSATEDIALRTVRHSVRMGQLDLGCGVLML